MPIRNHHTKAGYYFQYGNQAKYFYDPKNNKSIIRAYNLALAQTKAINVSKMRKQRILH